LTSWIQVLPLTVGILTGCTTLRTTYDRIRATLNEPEVDETIHRYGAWLLTMSKGHTGHQGISFDAESFLGNRPDRALTPRSAICETVR
jgi:hypothetical protein